MAFKLDTVIAKRTHKTIYKEGEFVIKVFDETFPKSDILNEALNQARVEETGLPIPKIHDVMKLDDGRWAIVQDYIAGPTLQELMDKNPDKTDEYLDRFVDIQLNMHGKKAHPVRPWASARETVLPSACARGKSRRSKKIGTRGSV